MSSEAITYQCPNCMGPLHYSSETGNLLCDHCQSSYTPEYLEDFNLKMLRNGDASDWGPEAENMQAYSCPACGAELFCEKTTSAEFCPYCGNPTILPQQFQGILRPEYIIPFRVDQKKAEETLRRHTQNKFLLPVGFIRQSRIHKVQGAYIPFWLYDGDILGDLQFRCVSSVSYRSGENQITENKYYEVQRKGTLHFQKLPADGSMKMNDALMDSLEPYDYRQLREFSTAYLPGFLARKYDITPEKAFPRARFRCENTLEEILSDTVHGYSSVIPTGMRIDIENLRSHYALLPVWILTTRWKEKNYIFAVNGQTGKLAGDLPADPQKSSRLFWGIGVGLSLLLSLLISGPLGQILAALLGMGA